MASWVLCWPRWCSIFSPAAPPHACDRHDHSSLLAGRPFDLVFRGRNAQQLDDHGAGDLRWALVDNSVVMAENMHRHCKAAPLDGKHVFGGSGNRFCHYYYNVYHPDCFQFDLIDRWKDAFFCPEDVSSRICSDFSVPAGGPHVHSLVCLSDTSRQRDKEVNRRGSLRDAFKWTYERFFPSAE